MKEQLYIKNENGETLYNISALSEMTGWSIEKMHSLLSSYKIEQVNNQISQKSLARLTDATNLITIYYDYCLRNNMTAEKPPTIKHFFNDFYLNAQYFTKNGYIDIDFLMTEIYLDDASYCLKINGDMFFSYSFLRIVTTNEFKERLKNSPSNTKPAQKTYIMKDGTGYYKIGKSQDPSLRESTIKTGNSTIELIAVLDDNIEHDLHQEYELFNVRGEWFQLSDKQIKEIIHKHGFKKI